MASVVDICNKALGWLGANKITSLNDDTEEGRLCDTNYDSIRDAVLEAADWSFAIKRVVLPPLAMAPAFGPSYQAFQIPADCIRVLSVSSDDQDRRRIYWILEGREILVNNAVAYVRYMARVEDPSFYSPLFVEALAQRIAADLAIPIVQSRTLQESHWAIYERKVQEAKANDGLQGKHPNTRSDSLQTARWRYGVGMSARG